MYKQLILILLVLFTVLSFGQQNPKTRILFVFDDSNSMSGMWESNKKIDVAKDMLIKLVDSLQTISNVEIALRVYGFQSYVPPQDCNDTKLVVPFSKDNKFQIISFLNNLEPRGTTPIARSLELAANDFPECANCRNIIILITDGIEACDGDPCAVSLALQKRGVILRPFVIGIGLDVNFKDSFECIGTYYDAKSESDFKDLIGVIIYQALNNTTCQVNLLSENGLPSETDVNMTFYDRLSGSIKHNFIHTINHRGNPDTIALDPLYTYDVVIHTIPPVHIDSIKLEVGKHSIFATDAPQGILQLKDNSSTESNVNVIVRKAGTMNTINVQNINTTEKYIVDKYDLEILTLPRIYLYDVGIKQSYTTTIQIPKPGTITVIRQYNVQGSIYTKKDDKMVWVCNLQPSLLRKNIKLQPGKYTIIYRNVNEKRVYKTKQSNITVASGATKIIRLN